MEHNVQRVGLVNLFVLLAVGLAGIAVGWYSHSLSAQVAAVFIGFGFLVAAISYFQIRLEAREALERLELEEMTRSAKTSALFATTDSEVLPARRAREQFERFIVPGFTVLLFALQGVAVYFLWRRLFQLEAPQPLVRALVALALFGLLALILFLLGKYSAAIARLEGQRLLRPAASYLLWAAYLCFVVAAAVAVVAAGSPRIDLYVARVLVVLLGLIGVETLLNLVLEIYRPRVRGQEARLLYESRLVGLLGQPEGLITTAAQALDYQFGFKVSETWFYRFLEKALGWLILAQLALLLLSSCFVFIEPGEQALLERWGRPVSGREMLGSGFHLKWPWPMDKVYRHHTERIQSFNIGFVPDDEKEHAEKTLLWTVPHYKDEYNLLVASREQIRGTNLAEAAQAVPVNLLTVSIPVQYRIVDLRAWAYGHRDAGKLLEQIATREAVRYFVSVDLGEIMSTGRPAATAALEERIQKAADDRGLGVRILMVGLQDIHPPVKVAAEFQKVIGALQEKEARILEAEAYRARTVPEARAEKERRIREAEAYKVGAVASLQAQAGQFTNQLQAFGASPSVYLTRAYLQMISRAIPMARKYVNATTNNNVVIQMNLEDKIRSDLLDVRVPGLNER